jgi:adenylate cyclase, class 2
VPVEVELTAIVHDPDRVRAALNRRADPRHDVYADTYFDRPDGSMGAQGYKLRIRTIINDEGTRVVLTYKHPPIEGTQGSRPEYETSAADGDVLHTIFGGLGLIELISFEKYCENYRFTEQSRDLLATLVRIPELDGQTFIEVETMTGPGEVPEALEVVRSTLEELGIGARDLSTRSYADCVAARRRG